MWKYAHLALITITQLYLTFVTFLKYYQFIYIMNNVISSPVDYIFCDLTLPRPWQWVTSQGKTLQKNSGSFVCDYLYLYSKTFNM
jgi:hypothetical protein